MAGHSKWKNIQHRKNAQDAKRGKVFTKIATEITVAVRLGGGEEGQNPRLRTALLKGRGVNMPKDNIERAIKKGLGDMDGVNYAEKSYEGFGPAGVAFVVECLTDNANRTASDVRHCFSRFGGNLGTEGSVSWQFHRKGQLVFDRSRVPSYESLMDAAIESGAEDVKDEEGAVEVIASVNGFLAVKEALEAKGFAPDVAALTRIPETYTKVTPEDAETVRRMIDTLEDMDDVQSVHHNADMPED